jgi:repressor of nif and glnA expression
MGDTTDGKRLAILRILREKNEALSSETITRLLLKRGFKLTERTVRFHLLKTDESGLTEIVYKKGRQITKKGITELSKTHVIEKVGFFTAKIDQMIYRMSFKLSRLKGTVVGNVSYIKRSDLKKAVPLMKGVFKSGYAMGCLLTLFKSVEQAGEVFIPEGHVGIGTVCSVTLNGVLLSHGIPVTSRFGGLLEIIDHVPERFVEIIMYDGTTVDPLEVFIKSCMTNYTGAINNGNGQIGAGFREIPMGTEKKVLPIIKRLEKAGLGGFLKIGWSGQSLLGIPINEGRVGMVLIGGLNPVAILEEHGIKVHSKALSCLIDYKRLFSYEKLEEYAEKICNAS